MNDDPLEQLRVELSVEPSPEFAAKVRARIAREPKRRWTTMAMWSLAAAAAVVLVVVAVRPGREQARAVVTGAPAVATAEPEAAGPPVPSRATPVKTVAPRVAPVRAAASSSTRISSVAPQHAVLEVLVPGDERRALSKLLADLDAGRVEGEAIVGKLVEPAPVNAPPAEIVIAPIEIPAIGGPGGIK